MGQKKEKWPEWEIPNDEVQILLAKSVLPHLKIISPEIVKLIVADNNKNFARWSSQLKDLGIRSDVYLWENSPVVFPGVRRHVGAKELANFNSNSKTAKGKNALILDDNSFPKELWSYALRNCKYDKTNPQNYSLAHIVDHKDYKSRHQVELSGFEKKEDENLFAGLYTSCVNTFWVPVSLLKPTDHNGKLRRLLMQIINKYYSSVCTVLPHKLSFNLDNIEDKWTLDKFPDPIIVGNSDNIKNFIEYRKETIDELIKNFK